MSFSITKFTQIQFHRPAKQEKVEISKTKTKESGLSTLRLRPGLWKTRFWDISQVLTLKLTKAIVGTKQTPEHLIMMEMEIYTQTVCFLLQWFCSFYLSFNSHVSLLPFLINLSWVWVGNCACCSNVIKYYQQNLQNESQQQTYTCKCTSKHRLRNFIPTLLYQLDQCLSYEQKTA